MISFKVLMFPGTVFTASTTNASNDLGKEQKTGPQICAYFWAKLHRAANRLLFSLFASVACHCFSAGNLSCKSLVVASYI